MLLRSNFSSFPHYFIYIFLTLGVELHIHLLNVVQFIVFLTLSTLICRGTDISKYFSESLGIRDNESRLYFILYFLPIHVTKAYFHRTNSSAAVNSSNLECGMLWKVALCLMVIKHAAVGRSTT